MAFPLEGLAPYSQNILGDRLAVALYQRCPALAILAGKDFQNSRGETAFGIGRPDGMAFVSGAFKSKNERAKIINGDSYSPLILTATVNNNKNMGLRDTMPTVANPTTLSHDQLIAGAKFRWARKVEPILVWKEALRRDMRQAGPNRDARRRAMGALLEAGTKIAMLNHVEQWAASLWTGGDGTTSTVIQSADNWNDILGITVALDSSNTYGNVDRSATGNSSWQAKKVSTARKANITDLIDEANIDQGARTYGTGIDLVLAGATLYRAFKDQIRAKTVHGEVNPNVLPENGKFGFKMEGLIVDNTIVVLDPKCPASTVACLNTESWLFATSKDMNAKVTEFIDFSKYSEGAKEAFGAYIQTEAMLVCENPAVNVIYSSVS